MRNEIFSLFILYVDGIIGNEALVVITNLIWLMEEKTEEPILQVRFWVNGWTAIVVAKFYSHMIRGDCLPSPLQDRDKDWELVSGMRLAQ